ncbi:MAG TPA: D-alanyl-D-alanine carboxypeptidase [Candidatus Woesebacteria bacterium]|nr:D-alanyl-D-alanine carboxypeptidase [Candidatus Woesebacteria bacterium]HPJ16878.1 D-alanyl-D-alanine carboxypeptidase [Candidatus Woesebacteria bacterium]
MEHKTKINLLILVIVGLFTVFSIPTFGFWKFQNYLDSKDQTASELINFQHPQIPQVNSKQKPQLQAQSAIIVDSQTNQVLYSQNSDQKIYPASVTKLATAVTALNIYPLNEVITVGSEYQEGKVMELKTGERITIKSLVEALLVYSANDAAFNLANHHSGGQSEFIKEMNLISNKYGLKNTHFTNYDGIHHPDHYSTVYDLSQLARLAIKNPVVREVVKNKNLTVVDIDKQYSHQLVSTNELLGVVPEVQGLKTGWTPEAGGCFVGLINLDGHELITVVAQSPDRFADTKNLINWLKESVVWQDYRP